MDPRTLYDRRAVPLNVGRSLNGGYGRSHTPNIGRKTRKEAIGKGNKKSPPNEEEMAMASKCPTQNYPTPSLKSG